MSDPSVSAATRRLVWLAILLAAVLALMFWLRSRALPPGPPPGSGAPSASVVEPASFAAEQAAERAIANLERASGRVEKTTRDRGERERVRERIYRSLGQPLPPPSPGAAARAALPPEAGTLSPDYIRKRIREDFVPLAKECYEAALERDAALAGKLVFNFVIVGDESVGGIVESAEPADSSTLTEKELVYCLRESLLSVSFEPPQGGGSVTVTYPFRFDPKGDGG